MHSQGCTPCRTRAGLRLSGAVGFQVSLAEVFVVMLVSSPSWHRACDYESCQTMGAKCAAPGEVQGSRENQREGGVKGKAWGNKGCFRRGWVNGISDQGCQGKRGQGLSTGYRKARQAQRSVSLRRSPGVWGARRSGSVVRVSLWKWIRNPSRCRTPPVPMSHG